MPPPNPLPGVEVDLASLYGQSPASVAAGNPISRQVPGERSLEELFASSQAPPENPILGAGSDAVSGFVKSAGSTAVGIGELLTRAFDAAGEFRGTATDMEALNRAITGDKPAFDETQAGLAPTNTAQKVGAGAEQMAEFFGASAVKTPAAIAKLIRSPAALAALRSAAETVAVRSAQEGELPSAEEVGLGAAAGGVAHGAARLVKAGGGAMYEHAPETAAKIFKKPGQEFARNKEMEAIRELLDGGQMPVGGIKKIAGALKDRTGRLGAEMEAYQGSVANELNDIRPLIDRLNAAIDERTFFGSGGSAPFDSDQVSQLRGLVGELEEMARVQGQPATAATFTSPGTRAVPDYNIPRGALENKLTAWQKSYPSLTASEQTSKEMRRLAADEFRPFMDEIDPKRATFTQPFSRALSLSDAATERASGAPFEKASGIGEGAAIRTAVGGAVGYGFGGGAAGMGIGALAGNLGIPVIVNFLRSPTYRSLSAVAQNRIGRYLMNTNPDNARAAFTQLGIALAPEGDER